jgi:hypothetical protein
MGLSKAFPRREFWEVAGPRRENHFGDVSHLGENKAGRKVPGLYLRCPQAVNRNIITLVIRVFTSLVFPFFLFFFLFCKLNFGVWANILLTLPGAARADSGVSLAKRPWINKMLKFLLYVFAGILGVALGVLVFLHQCVHLPEWTPKPSPTEHSVGNGSSS